MVAFILQTQPSIEEIERRLKSLSEIDRAAVLQTIEVVKQSRAWSGRRQRRATQPARARRGTRD